MARKGGLGKGLDALIPSQPVEGQTPTQGMAVSIAKIVPNPRQPRQVLREEDLQDLAASIKEHGIIQPLIVSYDAAADTYILIAGERRLKAAAMAGLTAVPVVIRQVNDQQQLELALIENIQRADLSPLETAEAYQHLHNDFGLSHEEIAVRVGKSRVAVTNTLRLLKLPESILKALTLGEISEGHARALLALTSSQAQVAALQTILNQKLTVRQTEELVQKLSGEKPAALPRKPIAPEIKALEEKLRDQLGTRVTMRHGKKGGTLTLHYYSTEELDTLLSILLKE
ncbi:stage 0 sporulation protein J [Ornatilinea apprima]|uniref:Stage 0 sporulation protein J n=1 Tax=Ornatilinea apprima TaxID=1134406 RepID=A0A0P6X3W0_9CHLR|nr:ParB/RepB/Spo0J family partition protein [Ornatilinea apprima]KPL76037.1 stage 0 sporulation protein J [Ornatilinea apprima]